MERGGSYHHQSHHHHQMQQFHQQMREQERNQEKAKENDAWNRSTLRVGPKRPPGGIGSPSSPMLKYLKIRVICIITYLVQFHEYFNPYFRFEACSMCPCRCWTRAPAFCRTKPSSRRCLLHGNFWGENFTRGGIFRSRFTRTSAKFDKMGTRFPREKQAPRLDDVFGMPKETSCLILFCISCVEPFKKKGKTLAQGKSHLSTFWQRVLFKRGERKFSTAEKGTKRQAINYFAMTSSNGEVLFNWFLIFQGIRSRCGGSGGLDFHRVLGKSGLADDGPHQERDAPPVARSKNQRSPAISGKSISFATGHQRPS